MKRLLLLPLSLILFAFVSFSTPALVYASTAKTTHFKNSAAIFPTWYEYLKVSPDGEIIMDKTQLPKNMILIGLAIIQILLVLAGILAVIMVMVGGFNYVISQGESEKLAKAKNTIINSMMGAVIAIIASQMVAFVVVTFVGTATTDPNYGLFKVDASEDKLTAGLGVFFAVIGAVSVFMIVLAGFNFIISGGNAEKITKARRTIYYSLIGLVVAIFASAIVSFVLKKAS